MTPKYFVTGAHYTATTLIGRVVSKSSALSYIHEPFSYRTWAPYWFLYIDEDNEHEYYDKIFHIITQRPQLNHLFTRNQLARSPKVYARKIILFLQLMQARFNNRGTVIKDPTGVLLSDWLSRRFDIPVVALIRHPGAFVESVVRKQSHHPFEHFLNQPHLMNKYLSPYTKTLHEFAEERKNLVEQGALLWILLNRVLCSYEKNNNKIKIFRHEDIALHPEEEFKKIMDHLGLPFEKKTGDIIMEYCSSENTSEGGTVRGGLSRNYVKRNPVASISKWKQRLSESQVELIKTYTCEIADRYYAPDEWRIN